MPLNETPSQPRRSPAATTLVAFGLAVAYALTGLLGMQLAAPPGNVTPVWLPAGLALAALLVFGRNVWPGITLGSWFLNVIVFPNPATFPTRVIGGLAIAISSTVGLVFIHWLTQRSKQKDLLSRPSALVPFWGWVLAGAGVNATGGALATTLLGGLPVANVPSYWFTWWLGDTVGILLLAPLVLTEGTRREARPAEWAATLVLTLLSCQLVFGVPIEGFGGTSLPLAWTISTGVVWAGARLGGPAVSVHTVLIYALMSWATVTGRGPFAPWPRELAMLLDDGLLVAVSTTGQLLASLAALARGQQAALEQERRSLEARVAERTSQLEASTRSLLSETEVRAKLSERLVEAQKQEALGRLAGGVAHDFNNLLTVVSGEAELLRRQGHPTDVHDGAGAILAAAHRAGELTRQLLAVARRQPSVPRHLDLPATLATNRRLLRPLLPESVTLDVTCTEPCGVFMDPTSFDQIVLNLAINARDAITGAGHVKVEARPHTLDEAAAVSLGLRAGKYVCLSVSDDGTGIPPDVLPRIFEPFFTTKVDGRGTGLGLSTVLGLATQSRGTVKVSSADGRTVFSVWLPASDGEAQEEAATQVVADGVTQPSVVLVVEDEPLVRRTVVLALERAGHKVLTAGDGEEALALLRQAGHGVQLLLTDVIMPRMGGVELARAVRSAQPGMPVVFMSGFHERQAELAGEHVLAKPFTADQLLSAVQAALRA